MTGCGSEDDIVVEEEPVDPQDVVTVGVAVSSPGLISGVTPAEVTGAEIDLVTALVEQMDSLPSGAEIFWVPTTTATVAEDHEQFQVAIGQFSQAAFDSSSAQVGPYVTVQPGLLVHQEPSDDATPSLEPLAVNPIETLEDLADASVCVVSGSLAAGAELPAEQTVLEPTVTECEVGMRSGRYDAISADDLQLAGLLVDPAYSERYELLSWDEVADEPVAEQALDERLTTAGSYWLGVDADLCGEAAEALETLVDDGVVEEAFSPLDSVEGFQVQTVDAPEVTTAHCESAD
jgi:ABC-type amino acid transport substrate-binding protein